MSETSVRSERSVRPRWFRNVLSNWSVFAYGAIINFGLSPFVVRQLGDAGYGAWVLLGSLVGYLGLLDLGVRGAVMRYVARFHATGNDDDASRIASAGLFLFTIAGSIAIAGAALAAWVGVGVFDIPAQYVTAARIVLVLGGLNIAVALVSGVFGGVITGLERFDLNSGLEIAIETARAVSVVLALSNGLGLVGLAVIQLACAVIRGTIQFVLCRRLYPQLTLMLWGWGREQLTQIFSFSVFSTLMHISARIILYTDSVVIGAALPVSMIAFFAIAGNLVAYARALISGISQTVTPRVSANQGLGREEELRRSALAGGRFATLVVLPIVLTFIFRGASFIGLWMGPSYADLSGRVLRILAITLWAGAGNQILTATMMGLNRHRGLVPAYIAAAICNLGLSILWVRSYGIVGVAWGTALPNLVVSLIYSPWYIRRVLRVPPVRLWFDVWLRPSAAMIPFAAGTYLVEAMWPASNLVVFFAQVAGVLPLALAGAWALGLTAAERKAYSRPLRLSLRATFARS